MLLTGRGTYILDLKKRMALPKEMRAELGEKVYVAPGFEPETLALFPENMMETIKAKVNNTLTFTEAYKINRRVFPNAHLANIDVQGRILIPQDILDKASIAVEMKLTVEGLGDYAIISKAEAAEKWLDENQCSLGEIFDQAGI